MPLLGLTLVVASQLHFNYYSVGANQLSFHLLNACSVVMLTSSDYVTCCSGWLYVYPEAFWSAAIYNATLIKNEHGGFHNDLHLWIGLMMPGYRKPTPNLIVLVNQISTQECGGVYRLLGPDKLITSIKGVVFLSVYDGWLVGWFCRITQKLQKNPHKT